MKRTVIITMIAGFVFSLQNAATVYVNSSYASLFVNDKLVGLLYTIAAILALTGTHVLPKMISARSAKPILLSLLTAGAIILFGLSVITSPVLFALLFILYFAVNTFAYYCFDIIIESLSTTTTTGRIRGAFLTSLNMGYVIAPFISGNIVEKFSYPTLYAIVAGVLLLVVVLVACTQRQQSTTKHTESLAAYRSFFTNRDLRGVFVTNFLLQFFYAWMVIYTPIYLHEYLHISWQTLGIIFTIMLSAFVLLQYPLGRLADLILGEKELMIGGLIIAALATPLIVIVDGHGSIWILGLLLFATRVGASAIEVASESYFFKHIKTRQTRSLSIFRSTSSIAYIIAPLLGSLILNKQPIEVLFFVLATILIIGTIAPLSIKDTR